jgi:excisionase family DNA binding protein
MISIKQASNVIGIHPQTLRKWEKQGKIKAYRTKSNQRRFDVKDVEKLSGKTNDKFRKKYIYCRVSSRKQKEDLDRQIKFMQKLFPEYETIYDISSGITHNRPGFNKILVELLQGNVETIAVSYKDRLSRFSYEFIKQICDFHRTKITVVNNKNYEPHEEIAEDIIAIITSFSAKIHGNRRYSKGKSL